ncbi:MAG: response regulator, partial [Ruminococcus sp.]
MICLLVDDEPLLLRKLQRTVAEVLPEADIHAYTNAKEALSFAENSRIDIAFLDIRIRGMDGIELAKILV